MRRILYLLAAIMAFGAFSCSAPLTAEEKAVRAKLDTLAYMSAVARLDSMEFIIPAQTVQINGRRVNFTANDMINFISAHDGQCVVQLASAFSPFPGPNGLGGITAKGNVSLLSKKADNRGTIVYEYKVNSLPQSMRIVLRLPYLSTRAQAEVSGNLRGGNVFITGDVKPWQIGRTAEGYSL